MGMAEALSYASKNLFFQNNTIWSKNEVKKPRLPTLEELDTSTCRRWVDTERPDSFSLFIGDHNISLNSALLTLIEDFVDANALPKAVLLHGARGG